MTSPSRRKAWTTDLRSDLSSSIAPTAAAGKPSNYVKRCDLRDRGWPRTCQIQIKLSVTITLSLMCRRIQRLQAIPAATRSPPRRPLAFMRIPVADGRQAHLAGFAQLIFRRDAVRWQRQSARSASACLGRFRSGVMNHDIDGSEMLSSASQYLQHRNQRPGRSARASADVANKPAPFATRRQIRSTVTVDGNTLLVRIEPFRSMPATPCCSVFSTSGASTSSGQHGQRRDRLLYGRCSDNNDDSLLTRIRRFQRRGFADVLRWGTPQVVKSPPARRRQSLQNPLF